MATTTRDSRQVAERRKAAADLLVELHAMPAERRRFARARGELVELHMPLVIYLARRFSGRSEPMDDLVQVGVIGLLKAIDRFEPERGLAFSTYATPTILGEIKRHFRDTGWLVHVPRRAREMQAAVRMATNELSQRAGGRAPTIAQIAQFLGVADELVVEALDAAQAYSGLPLEELTPGGETVASHPALASTEDGFERTEHREVLRVAIAELPRPERETLLLRYFGNKTQTEIAGILGVSQMQISRLVARGLGHLREKIDPDVLLV